MLKRKKKLSISAVIIVLGTIVAIYLGIDKIYYNRVIFGFKTDTITIGTLSLGNSKNIYLMLLGTATNKGKKPLIPSYFDLKIKVEGKWISWRKMTIPQNFMPKSETYNIEMKDAASKDLQEWSRPITIEEPARGNLLFINNELDIKSLRVSNSITFQLTCVDVFNNKYKFTTTPGLSAHIDRRVKLIKHDVIIEPKD